MADKEDNSFSIFRIASTEVETQKPNLEKPEGNGKKSFSLNLTALSSLKSCLKTISSRRSTEEGKTEETNKDQVSEQVAGPSSKPDEKNEKEVEKGAGVQKIPENVVRLKCHRKIQRRPSVPQSGSDLRNNVPFNPALKDKSESLGQSDRPIAQESTDNLTVSDANSSHVKANESLNTSETAEREEMIEIQVEMSRESSVMNASAEVGASTSGLAQELQDSNVDVDSNVVSTQERVKTLSISVPEPSNSSESLSAELPCCSTSIKESIETGAASIPDAEMGETSEKLPRLAISNKGEMSPSTSSEVSFSAENGSSTTSTPRISPTCRSDTSSMGGAPRVGQVAISQKVIRGDGTFQSSGKKLKKRRPRKLPDNSPFSVSGIVDFLDKAWLSYSACTLSSRLASDLIGSESAANISSEDFPRLGFNEARLASGAVKTRTEMGKMIAQAKKLLVEESEERLAVKEETVEQDSTDFRKTGSRENSGDRALNPVSSSVSDQTESGLCDSKDIFTSVFDWAQAEEVDTNYLEPETEPSTSKADTVKHLDDATPLTSTTAVTSSNDGPPESTSPEPAAVIHRLEEFFDSSIVSEGRRRSKRILKEKEDVIPEQNKKEDVLELKIQSCDETPVKKRKVTPEKKVPEPLPEFNDYELLLLEHLSKCSSIHLHPSTNLAKFVEEVLMYVEQTECKIMDQTSEIEELTIRQKYLYERLIRVMSIKYYRDSRIRLRQQKNQI